MSEQTPPTEGAIQALINGAQSTGPTATTNRAQVEYNALRDVTLAAVDLARSWEAFWDAVRRYETNTKEARGE